MNERRKTFNAVDFQQAFLLSLRPDNNLARFFDYLPDVYFYAKNHHSQFTVCNKALLKLNGFETEAAMLGKTDLDFYPAQLAEKYIEEDQLVLAGQSIIDKLWLVPHKSGKYVWYLSTKIPLYDNKGTIIGLAGILRDDVSETDVKNSTDMSEVIAYIDGHCHEKIAIKTLADILDLSISQFERKFKKTLLVTPSDYIVKIRINKACAFLAKTTDSISTIAQNCGFYDHSDFTRHFVKAMGITPRSYRDNMVNGN